MLLSPNGTSASKLTVLILLCSFCCGCTSLHESSKYGLTNGRYKLHGDGPSRPVYLHHHVDSISLYDPMTKEPIPTTEHGPADASEKIRLSNPSLDLDVLSILFKFRPAAHALPPQLNTNFNGNIYLGRRTDIYTIRYIENPLGARERHIDHIGFSMGLFAGIGSTTMDPFTTDPSIAVEYEGLVVQTGISVIVAVNRLSVGLGVGVDDLMDGNKRWWIYQHRPWYGLMLGLNLN